MTGAGDHGSVSDSGAESCGEEARLRTAEVFMSGIQTAITANLEERGQQVKRPRRTEASRLRGHLVKMPLGIEASSKRGQQVQRPACKDASR